ncbi:tetratricopeptide repeat protein [Helicobacter ailurogastricus]|uniref:tetratricopeptide repeat protein n=1 Tax=Helicobacter ailurogastricus TaxID=1578720 RepID=UPI0022C69A30|nr:sel1 repeat family protein [Helicobacter ailurogastricus]GLH58725.1 hypothetical protein NHP214376_15210 [Helicobacter ailurogastricus]GLH59926.1 hypothetical protein NHP214377_11970 [Helicobacter ailurogastricus]
MQQAYKDLSQELKATKRTHKHFLLVLEDIKVEDLTPIKEELETIKSKFYKLLNTLGNFNIALEDVYEKSEENDTELEKALVNFKRVKVRANIHLNALERATEGTQAIENTHRLSQSLEDLESLLNAVEEKHASLLLQVTCAGTDQDTEASNADALRPCQRAAQTAKNINAPEVKPLWQYGANTLQAFKDYMKAKDLGNAQAWLELGKMAMEGVVLYPDHNVAIRCFSKAVELCSVEALVELGKIAKANYRGIWVLEHESGKAISGKELNDSFKLFGIHDHYAILEHCKVFKDKTLSVENSCHKARELFERATEVGEGKGFLELWKLYLRDYKRLGKTRKEGKQKAMECCKQAISLLRAQAEKGDGEAYALCGEALAFVCQEEAEGETKSREDQGYQAVMQLFEKARDLGYADAFYSMANFDFEWVDGVGVEKDKVDRCIAYLQQGMELGSGKCACRLKEVAMHASNVNLPHAHKRDLSNYPMLVEQAMVFVDRLAQCIKLLEFVALKCRHHKALPVLLMYSRSAKKIIERLDLENVERYKKLLDAHNEYKRRASHLARHRHELDWDLAKASGIDILGEYSLRAFKIPAKSNYEITPDGCVQEKHSK